MASKKVVMYTDGACSGNPGNGGWGAYIEIDDKKIELSGSENNTTNNRMELKAVIYALDYLSEKREIIIHDFLIKSVNFPEIEFSLTCSKGTYIRSLAHDFGKELGSGAHLSELRRTFIGDYSVDNSLILMEFIRNI